MKIKEKYIHSDNIGNPSYMQNDIKTKRSIKKETYVPDFLNILKVFYQELLALLILFLFSRQSRFCFTYLNLSILKNKKLIE